VSAIEGLTKQKSIKRRRIIHMRAIVIDHFGGLDSLVIKEMPEPGPKLGDVVIEVKAFGTNYAEMHMRKEQWAEAAEISGIECVGIVKSCPGGEFAVGSKVAALMEANEANGKLVVRL